MIDNRENNIYTVYIHIIPKALSNYDYDKYYVGITRSSVDFRWKKDGYGYVTQTLFYKAIKKYGWDNIEHHIIAEHLTEQEAMEFEKLLIKTLKCNANKDKYGYNLTDGGEGISGYCMPQEQKEIRSMRYSGQNNPFYGKTHTEETRKKMKQNHKDFSGGNHPEAKRIYQFNLDGTFVATYPSVHDAAKLLHVSDSMGRGAKYHKKSMGYLWAYDEDIIMENNIPKLNFAYIDKPPKHYKHVYMFDNNKIFLHDYISCGEAGKDNNMNRIYIARAARKKGKSGNYIWRYKEDVGFTEDGIPYFIA